MKEQMLPILRVTFGITLLAAAMAAADPAAGIRWRHPVGEFDLNKLAKLPAIAKTQAWAKEYLEGLAERAKPWLECSDDVFLSVVPRRRGEVGELFICPDCRVQLPFELFKPDDVECPRCHKLVDTSQACPTTDRWGYHGTIWQGWVELWQSAFGNGVQALGYLYQATGEPAYAERAARLLTLFAEATRNMPVETPGGYRAIYMYHREGDCRLLGLWANTYECIRDCPKVTDEQRQAIVRFLRRSTEEGVMDPEGYETDWNDIYFWNRGVLLAGIACEEKRYLDFVFGLGDYSPERRPAHRSLRYVAQHHFRADDGTFWENTTSYDFAVYWYMVQMLVTGHMLSQMDPAAFRPVDYDFTHPDSPFLRPMRRALYGYLAYCLPDGTQITVGDYGMRNALFGGSAPLWNIGRLYLNIPEAAAFRPKMTSSQRFFDFIHDCGPWGQGKLPQRSALLPRGMAILRDGQGPEGLYAHLPHLVSGGDHQHYDRLGLILWGGGRVLLGEKAGGEGRRQHTTHRLSCAHNLVVVGGKDQAEKVTPAVHHFLGGKWLQMVDVSVAGAYPAGPADAADPAASTADYRRTLFMVDGFLADIFRVTGAGESTRDWLLHPYGDSLEMDLPLQPSQTQLPAEYLEFGLGQVKSLRTAADIHAQWAYSQESLWPEIEPKAHPCRLRTTVLGADGTEVFTFLSRPYRPNVIFATDPADWSAPIHTLMLRRTTDDPFVAVHDVIPAGAADAPVQTLALAAGPGAVALLVTTPRSRVLICHAAAAGQRALTPPGLPPVTLTGDWCVVQWPAQGDQPGAMAFSGTQLQAGSVELEVVGEPATVCGKCDKGRWRLSLSAPVADQTLEGRQVPLETVHRTVTITQRTGEQTVRINRKL